MASHEWTFCFKLRVPSYINFTYVTKCSYLKPVDQQLFLKTWYCVFISYMRAIQKVISIYFRQPKNLWKMALHNFRTFMYISTNFMHCLYEIITVRIGYHKFCSRCILKILTGAHKTQRMAYTLTFLERYHKDEGVQVIKSGFHFWKLKPKGSQSSGCTHIHHTSWKSLKQAVGLPESWW
jgi:hypothetical protein